MPVASDCKVTDLALKLALPPVAILNVLPGDTVKLPVPLILKMLAIVKSMFNCGVPKFIAISELLNGTAFKLQLPATFQRLLTAPVHMLVVDGGDVVNITSWP